MSLFINDSKVKAPASCKECLDCAEKPTNNSGFYLLTNCPLWKKVSKGEINAANIPDSSRNKDCPLVETPPLHGRLVDADDIIMRVENFDYYVEELDANIMYTPDIVKTINEAPTVIEEEN